MGGIIYIFNFHTNGPYSASLSEDYTHIDLNIKTLTKNDSRNILKSLKPYISQDDASKSFDNIVKFNLFDKTIVDNKIDNIIFLENIVKDNAKGLMDIYETFDTSSNRLFILGSLDFFRIVLPNRI